ncbi:MAG: type II toxin-antitoxin system VapC family toxin [Candidatus Levybacteria bacterium]|nr:type II toxin-antitoxin system VapC family toxin [Candidatus Levybacteria bacterium]
MIVLDASVATKFINTQEKESNIAEKLLQAHIEEKEKIIIPSLLFFEVANALATKTDLKGEYIKRGLRLLYDANFVIYKVNQEDIIEAALLAKKYKTSVYDMVYAVIAKNKKINLITADNKFTNKVNFSFVQTLSKLN